MVRTVLGDEPGSELVEELVLLLHAADAASDMQSGVLTTCQIVFFGVTSIVELNRAARFLLCTEPPVAPRRTLTSTR